AMIAGVLSWSDPGLASFSKKHRKDQELFDTLAARGVPGSQRILLLDNNATAPKMFAALDRLAVAAANAAPGSTLIFYFACHGVQNNSKVIFASADTRLAKKDTGFHVDKLGPFLASRFRGQRVILMADSCYSGALRDVAKALRDSGVKAVALTSAE